PGGCFSRCLPVIGAGSMLVFRGSPRGLHLLAGPPIWLRLSQKRRTHLLFSQCRCPRRCRKYVQTCTYEKNTFSAHAFRNSRNNWGTIGSGWAIFHRIFIITQSAI